MPTPLEQVRERFATLSDLGRAGALLAWDERTKMPKAGGEARAEQLATLARLGHELLIDDELAALLESAAAEVAGRPEDSDDASLVRVGQRITAKARRVPSDLRAELTRTASRGEQAWVEAREASDFAAFLPHLERNIELTRSYIECFAPYEHPYDPLLDDYEPGMRTADLEPVLAALRDGLRPLLDRLATATAPDASCLHGDFPLEGQRELGERVLAALPIPAQERRLDETVHPFAVAIAPTDLRITTRYEPTYVGTALWAVMHEAGHAMYENGIPAELARSPLGHGLSLGFHESQSRLWENWVGRSRGYLAHLLPMLREVLPGAFEKVSADELYRAANRVDPSLIRVEADEATYNLHIILRFELEVGIFTGEIAPADLPEAWNTRMRELLGVEVPDDAHGVLQDVHWAGGAFGYFPTYSLGNVIAGQLWDLATAELPELDAQIAAGELAPLREWLRERLHRHGAKFEPAAMIERLTGGPLDAEPLLRQLEARYGAIYGLG
ncbi:MAG: carboxypeptidase M32 [Solirubrobacterales bacterium]